MKPNTSASLFTTFILVLGVFFLITSCSTKPFMRDRLRSDWVILAGSWSWDYSWVEAGGYVFPDTAWYPVKIVFDKSGYFSFYENGKLTESRDIYIEQFYHLDDTTYEFEFTDKNGIGNFRGSVSPNVLRLEDFPVVDSYDPLDVNWGDGNYFFREYE